ncbi:hypothetical protein CPC08DRAFT_721181 [Agrocybe pediades]|nr:hypothetical protein CPC08DRAFT_721181 [Agrocybe pediades]
MAERSALRSLERQPDCAGAIRIVGRLRIEGIAYAVALDRVSRKARSPAGCNKPAKAVQSYWFITSYIWTFLIRQRRKTYALASRLGVKTGEIGIKGSPCNSTYMGLCIMEDELERGRTYEKGRTLGYFIAQTSMTVFHRVVPRVSYDILEQAWTYYFGWNILSVAAPNCSIAGIFPTTGFDDYAVLLLVF